MKQRLNKVKDDTIIRIDENGAYVYTVDRSMQGYLKKIKAEVYAYDWEGNPNEWKIKNGNLAIVDATEKVVNKTAPDKSKNVSPAAGS